MSTKGRISLDSIDYFLDCGWFYAPKKTGKIMSYTTISEIGMIFKITYKPNIEMENSNTLYEWTKKIYKIITLFL